jgi:amidophosphoribosyltransferase
VRYSTSDSSRAVSAQPLVLESALGPFALAHNGNVVNAGAVRSALMQRGVGLASSSDSEVIAQLLAGAEGDTWEERIGHLVSEIGGAYSLTILTRDVLYVVRDPWGFRPLCIGKLNGGWVAASESCALGTVGATFLREVQPGEIIAIDRAGLRTVKPGSSSRHSLCIFEYIYFARPDSVIGGQLIHKVRQALGRRLAREHPADADLVIGIPDSATSAAIGFAQESGIPFSEGLMKNRYIGRTFIQPDEKLRRAGVALKFNPLPEILQGKRLVVVDDSIVRGNTSRPIMELLRRAGAAELHMRISSPPIRHPCFMGVDMARREELIAHRLSVEQIREHIGVDSIGYLSLEGLLEAVDMSRSEFCLACFSGDYPLGEPAEQHPACLVEQAEGLETWA